MAEQVTHICDHTTGLVWRPGDWTDLPEELTEHLDRLAKDPAPTCGKPAKERVDVHISDITLSGDLCEVHRDALIGRLRTIAGLTPNHVKVDSKPRATYVTKRGKIVATATIRKWALDKGHAKSLHGRLKTALIQEYVDTH